MARVALITLGCPKNAVDSEGLGGLLAAGGHDVSEEAAGADVAVVNTCGFIDPARRETVQEVLDLAELKTRGELGGLVLTGCLVARSADELADSLPEVDAFVDFAAYPRISEIVDGAARSSLDERIFGSPGTRFDPAWWDASMQASPRLRFGRTPWSYVKIAEGCDRGCTFCAIPLMRGRFRSRSPEAIENEVRSLAEQGVSEISLVSQDSVMWGRDEDHGNLVSLLRRLERVDGIRRLRLMYLHPQGVTDGLIDVVLDSDVVVPYFDLSLQHVSRPVLKRMGRWGDADRFTRMIETIRTRRPDAAVRSTFILGFPGETDEDAEAVVSFVEETDLDWIGTFVFSREEGTRSFDLEEQVDPATARARAEQVSGAADRTMERRAGWYSGRMLDVLVERLDVESGLWVGRSHREAPEVDGEVRFRAHNPLRVGDIVPVAIEAAVGADLVGVAGRA